MTASECPLLYVFGGFLLLVRGMSREREKRGECQGNLYVVDGFWVISRDVRQDLPRYYDFSSTAI